MNSVEAIQDFRVDPTVFTLKGGGRPDCGGMVLVVGWSWGIDPATHYAQLAADLAALDPALHVYDARHLHCTVATLSSFKNSGSIFFHASAADRHRIIEAWHQALEAAFARTEALESFEIVFRTLETSPAATFLQAEDGSNTIEALRAAVREAAGNPQLAKLSAELEVKYSRGNPSLCSLGDAIHVPDIIHSTVMRLASEPSDALRLTGGLAGLEARWKPATVKVGEISLVYEKHPYMHFSRMEGAAHTYHLPFR